VSTKDQDRPDFTEQDAVQFADEFFNIQGVAQELPSERDRNFYIRTKSGKEFVLKIAATSEQREILDLQNAAMNHLREQGSSVNYPQVQKSRTGESIVTVSDSKGKPHFIRVLSYLPGKVFAKVNPHTLDLLLDLGKFVGQISHDFADFSHPAAQRDLYWDLKNAASVIKQHKDHIMDFDKRQLIERFQQLYELHVQPVLSQLRTSVIHNDGNDYNIIIDKAYDPRERRYGIIDFGDMVASHTVFELAVATAYAIMDNPDPIIAAAQVVRGYHSVFSLTEQEIELLFYLICTRLAMSVSICAYQQKLEPENEYLRISEQSAWNLLFRLKDVHPRFATYVFRHACNLTPFPQHKKIVKWLQTKRKQIGSIVELDLRSAPLLVFDLSVSSPAFSSLLYTDNAPNIADVFINKMELENAQAGIGRYNEIRWAYFTKHSLTAITPGREERNLHLGMDIFLEPGTPVLAPLAGRIHSLRTQATDQTPGSTIILEHQTDTKLKFFTMYGNVSEDSIRELEPGTMVKKGNQIATIGEFKIDDRELSHLHFQIILDLLDHTGKFPNMAKPSQREIWLNLCPDPNLILGIPPERFPTEPLKTPNILRLRAHHISNTLSIHYQKPLHIVRGLMQYLFDDTGKAYLDAVNNVLHVGHCHPHVVKALQEQAAVLNTNTRYLHENLVKYSQRLCATLPEPLRFCFFVNSGSEANELALRLAYTHTKQRDLIVLDGAYHGNTSNLIDISPYKSDGPGGKGTPPHVHKITMPDVYRGKYRASDPEAGEKYAREITSVLDQINKEGRGVAAFICEPLMGCGGQIIFPKNYLREAFRHVRQAGGICIVDEVQVGFGRVGSKFWGFQTQNVVPDIITLGKPMGNGHPLAAVITTPEIANSFNTGMEFFSTTGGNPVSCAVGMAVLDVIEKEGLQKHALKIGNYLMRQLRKLQKTHSIIGDVRGLGLFIGVELVKNRETLEPAQEEAVYIIERMKDLGVLISIDGPLRNVLKIKPPMVFNQENADYLIQALDRVLSEDFLNLSD
jgi:4-aminobutyrate aminotransferase-like enzyme/Ser/Thr protein kinase RdoA (MazF antagonist)